MVKGALTALPKNLSASFHAQLSIGPRVKLRQLASAGALYGLADMLVVAVSGFLLLPLYTRTLSQAEFGAYVVIRTNTEIIGYVIYLGLISAAARLYFDFREGGREREYLNTILVFFLAVAAVSSALMALVGHRLWALMSPSVPSEPYLWYTMALVVLGFLSQLGSLWLRLDQKVYGFVGLQVLAAGLLAAIAWIGLGVAKLGLEALLVAMLVGFLPPAVLLFVRLGRRLRLAVDRPAIDTSLRYGVPFAVSYVAYFVLNRFSLVTLQHHVPLAEIAIFGLAQQIGLIVALGSQSFAKAMQPAVFGASSQAAPEVLRRSSRLFIFLIFGLSAAVLLFAREILWLVAPREYQSGLNVVLVLLVANFVYALSLVSGTTLDYYRKPRTQAVVYILGAAIAVLLGLALIPTYGLIGGAFATFGAYAAATVTGHVLAYRVSGQSYFAEIAVAGAVICTLALLSSWPGWGEIFFPLSAAARLTMLALVMMVLAAAFMPQRVRQGVSWLGAKLRREA